jgi:hypothetical protein
LGGTGAGADPPQAPNDHRAATSLLSSPLAKVLLSSVAEADGDDRYGLVSAEELTVETESFDDNIVDTVVVPNPKLPKCLCTNLGPMPTKPDVPAPPLLKIVIANATKKIPKKKSQADTVTKLTKRRDDLLDCLQLKKIGQQRIKHCPTHTVKRVQRIPWSVQSGGGGRRIGHLTCATAQKSSGRNWNFGLRKKNAREAKCTG